LYYYSTSKERKKERKEKKRKEKKRKGDKPETLRVLIIG
jgi:hypothetical protein